MTKINVAVLRGGPSDEYDVSIATGGSALSHFPDAKYSVRDILISRDGVWHAHGLPTTPDRALQGIDVVFIGLHGEYGEGGEVQNLLDIHAIPYTGSGAFSSRIAMDKGNTRAHLSEIEGVKMPAHIVVKGDEHPSVQQLSQDIFTQFGPPYVVKPLRGGSSLGVTIAHSVQELPDILERMLKEYGAVIIEQFISGKEATCGVVEGMRGESLYSLPPIEIRASKKDGIWDYAAKYDGSTEEICPGNFTEREKEILQRAAREVHVQLGLSHYSRSDFIVAASGVYFLEVNTLPGLTPESLLPKSIDAIGVSFPDFLDHLVTLAKK